MSKRKRTVIALIVLEVMLACAWAYFTRLAATSSNASPESASVIGQVFGAAMGIVLGLSPVLYLMARNNDRKDSEGRARLP